MQVAPIAPTRHALTGGPKWNDWSGVTLAQFEVASEHTNAWYRIAGARRAGRQEGYDSLANARRAAYMLSKGQHKAAVGVIEHEGRFYTQRLQGEYGVRRWAPLNFENGWPIFDYGRTFTGNVVRDYSSLRAVVDGSRRLIVPDRSGNPV